MPSGENTVAFGEIDNAAAGELHVKEGGTSLQVVTNSIPKFKEVTCYTTFKAEWDLIGDDVVVHFYVPKKKSVTQKYWTEDFAAALNEVAQEHFGATLPRLVAKYTADDPATGEELNSWWFKAQKYGHILDLEGYMTRFYDKLDEKLDPLLTQALQKAR